MPEVNANFHHQGNDTLDQDADSPPEKPARDEEEEGEDFQFGKDQDNLKGDDSSISIDMDQFNEFTVWGVDTEFGENNEDERCEIKMAKGVAVSPHGVIALVEHALERVYLFDSDGSYQQTAATSEENPDNKHAKLLYPTDATFTVEGHVAVSDQSKYVKVFRADGDFIHRFNIKGDEDPAESKPKAYSITSTTTGHIITGDIRRKLLAIHEEGDGKSLWIRNIQLEYQPHFLAANVANGRYQILACDWRMGVVTAVDIERPEEEDDVLFTLDSFSVDGKPGLPKGIACDDGNNIYIAVSRLDDSGDNKNVFTDTGHIHQYSPTGKFERCIFKGLYHPRGLAWNNGSLFVANTRSVVIVNGT